MRLILSTTLALILLLPCVAEAQIKEETSAVTNTTRLVSTDMRSLVTESYPGHASFRAEYEATDTDTTWGLSFYGFADQTTEMSAASRVQLQADGQPISTQQVQSNQRTLDDKVLEIKHVTFRRAAYERIATAKQVTATIGPARFELTRPLRKDLRLILDRVPDVEGAPTATSTEEANR
jgi:hypothetical protein